MQEMYVNDIVVIHLHGLSSNLSEEDIKRLVPQASKDIEGWSDPDFIKVIPVRDDYTLERLDQYYVLFRNVRSARAFQDRVRILHSKTKAHATSSLLSALPPPPGFRDDRGDDLHAALQSYTLGPPASDRVYCNIVPYPYPRKLHDLFARGGYEPIVGAGGAIGADADIETVAKVLLWFIGPQPTIGELRKTIARDGKDRGMPWAVVDGIHGPEGVIRLTHHSKNEPANSDASEDRIERKVGVRYVINFENRSEAQRFSRRWHCEAFRWGGGVYENGEGPPEARTEVLW
ncbi:hypothetical protein DIS24_g1013 [Lasiodiplodia hormozganensis]|uniref:Uncharacterized protein n=1 Tax=Lasiodiplodia hormozganensis TaxID=869390 RepID=A0AA40D5M3_9PEZI|nr:hypothetical protein DIS24_g1013 [Lasiodiplodia hormozganensis]